MFISNNASLAIETKDNSTLIVTAGEKGKVLLMLNLKHTIVTI